MKKSRNNHDSSRPPSRPSQRNTASNREPVRRDPATRPTHDYDSSYDRRRAADSNSNRYRDSYNDRYNDRYSDHYSDRYSSRYDDEAREDPYGQPPRRSSSSGSGSRPRKSQAKRRRRFPISTVILLLVVVVLLVLLMKSCISDSLGGGTYKLELESQTLTVGATTQAKIVGLPEDPEGEGIQIKFITNHPDIATVDDSGEVTAHQLGDVTIAAIVNGKSIGNASLSVVETDGNATSVKLSLNTLTLKEGDPPFQLTAEVQGSSSDGVPLIIWKSSNDAAATVSSDGLVTARSAGMVAITATVGNQSDACMLTIEKADAPDPNAEPNPDPSTDPTADPNADPNDTTDGNTDAAGAEGAGDPNNTAAATGLQLNETEAKLVVGGTRILQAVITPDAAASLTVTWTSSDDNVATVSKGTILARAPGTTTITAKVGDFEAVCTVEVTES